MQLPIWRMWDGPRPEDVRRGPVPDGATTALYWEPPELMHWTYPVGCWTAEPLHCWLGDIDAGEYRPPVTILEDEPTADVAVIMAAYEREVGPAVVVGPIEGYAVTMRGPDLATGLRTYLCPAFVVRDIGPGLYR